MHFPRGSMLGSINYRIRQIPVGWLPTIADLIEKLGGKAGLEWLTELRKFLRKESCWVASICPDSTPIIHDNLTHRMTFEVEVPKDFALDTCPRTGFGYWNLNATDANFPRSGLMSGKKYAVEVYGLNCDKSSQSLVDIGMAHKRVLGGAKGGALLCSRYGEKLPKDRWVIAIDEKRNLWHDSRGAVVPGFGSDVDGWDFDLVYWADGCVGGDDDVVFFRELH